MPRAYDWRAVADEYREQVNAWNARGAKFYDSFDAYVADFPEAEHYRRWLTNGGYRPVWLLRDSQPWHACTLPGGYMWASVLYFANAMQWRVAVHDGDDFCIARTFDTDIEANALIDQMRDLAPFTFGEAVEMWGFVYE